MTLTTKAILTVLGISAWIFGLSQVSRAQEKPSKTVEPKIVECIKNGDVGCVSEFLGRGGNARTVDSQGSPLLIWAAETKDATVVRLLLNAGADVNDAGSGDSSPLCRAVSFGRKEIAQILFDAGAKAEVICDGDHGDSALMIAIRGMMFSGLPTDVKETLLSSEESRERSNDQGGGDTKESGVNEAQAASTDDYLEIARMLLSRNVDVNVIAKCDVGESALLYAAVAADVETVKTLLAHGASATNEPSILDVLRMFQFKDERAKWAKLPALSRQQAAMIDWYDKSKDRRQKIQELLTAAGAKESKSDDDDVDNNETAEDVARDAFDDVVERNDHKDLERLVAAYINHPLGAIALPNALRVAVIYSRVEMVKFLLKNGVNPNGPAGSHAPLMHAASSANLELVTLLVEAGADLNAADPDGRTALDAAEMYASSEASLRVAAFLKERGARNGKMR